MTSKQYVMNRSLRRGGLLPDSDDEEEKDHGKNGGKDSGRGKISVAVFYGVNCKPDIAKGLAKKLIEQFFDRFGGIDAEMARFLTMMDEMEDDDGSESEENSMMEDEEE